MKNFQRVRLQLWLALSLTFLLMSGISLSVEAVPVTFFGEDISSDYLNIAPGSNDHVVLADFANAKAARDDFANYLDATTWFEDFESFSGAAPTHDPNAASGSLSELTVNFGEAGKATILGEQMALISRKNSLPGWCGTYPTSGDQYLGLSTNGIDAKFQVTFEQAQSAFGFFATDFEMAPLTLTFENLLGEKVALDIPYTRAENAATRTNNGSVFFFGVIDVDNPFTTVTFETQSTWEGFGFDDFTIAKKEQIVNPVPEAGTLIYVSIGLLVLGRAIRKKAGIEAKNI